MGGSIASWPLHAAPAGPFPAGTGTVAGPFNGMCMTLAADGTTVVARKCSPGASSQQWTDYSDGTLRINSRCLDVTGPGAGAKVQVAACTGAASQKWEIGQATPRNEPQQGLPVASTAKATISQRGPGGQLADPWISCRRHAMPAPLGTFTSRNVSRTRAGRRL